MIFRKTDFEVGFGYKKIEEIIEAKKEEAVKRLDKAKEEADTLMREIEVLDLELSYAEDTEEGEEEAIQNEIKKNKKRLFLH